MLALSFFTSFSFSFSQLFPYFIFPPLLWSSFYASTYSISSSSFPSTSSISTCFSPLTSVLPLLSAAIPPISLPHSPPYHDPELRLNFGLRKASRRGSGYTRGVSSPRLVFLRAGVPRGCITPLPSCARRRYGVEPRGPPTLRTANSCDLTVLNDGQLT